MKETLPCIGFLMMVVMDLDVLEIFSLLIQSRPFFFACCRFIFIDHASVNFSIVFTTTLRAFFPFLIEQRPSKEVVLPNSEDTDQDTFCICKRSTYGLTDDSADDSADDSFRVPNCLSMYLPRQSACYLLCSCPTSSLNSVDC